MILTSLIIIILAGCFLHGRRRGLLMMLISLGTYLISLVAARIVARSVGNALANGHSLTNPTAFSTDLLQMVDGTHFFYNGIAFMLTFAVVSAILHWLLYRLNWLNRLPVLGTLNGWAGGLFELVLGYMMIDIILLILQLWPNDWWQMQFSQSGLAQWIVNNARVVMKLLVSWIG
ncbi:CvpA family protein [Limosilactobacillus difficilis]|uniref:CvpA family protein n=1 Tax=Limosilactobacillus difficilis TaxID=2991838 RepID=UPI0024B8B12B|nr:CvpA family protein [Limosilactobacillus difficilis]